MASDKRCLYEVLGVPKDSSPDQIRSAYRKLALQRHPDKLVQSGLTQPEATALFQELVHAYEVLSDPKERSWYDSHRSQILFSDPSSTSNSLVPNLFSFFSNTAYSGYSDSGKGFYKVYSDIFSKIYSAEIVFVKKLGLGLDTVREAPIMGNLESPYSQVTAFYNYWLGFCTVMDFCWVDQYDVTAGPNRKSRRLMEEENKKLRKKAKREYNETVRELAGFVKKRDKRVIDMMVRKNEEIERKKEEERERKKKLERERLERASRYEEPEWARIDEEEADFGNGIESDEDKRNEFYCVACGKKFKSEKQWKNHEQSKKHKEKVAELRETFANEEEEWEEASAELDGEVEELGERVQEGLGMEGREVKDGDVGGLSGDEDNDVLDADEDNEQDGVGEVIDEEDEDEGRDEDEEEDEEMSMLKAMMSGRKSRKKVDLVREDEVLQTEQVQHDFEPMEYDNRKSTRRKNRKEKAPKNTGEATRVDQNITKNKDEEAHHSHMEDRSSSEATAKDDTNSERGDMSGNNGEISNQPIDRGATKDKKTKLKNSSKGKKGKATLKNSGNVCEKCGEEFESRNRLHKHLGDTGHASLKSR